MKKKGNLLKKNCMKTLTLFITFVMLAFTFQYTIINLINLNDTLTQNFMQNPISEEEEEEEKVNESKDFHLFQSQVQLSLLVINEKVNSYFKSICVFYENGFIKTLKQPPEQYL